jgi:hypothetical protein
MARRNLGTSPIITKVAMFSGKRCFMNLEDILSHGMDDSEIFERSNIILSVLAITDEKRNKF